MTVPDVVVVGGGPVGLATAIAVRQRGFEVLVAERACPPIDKPCGEGLMPGGVAVLDLLGVLGDCAPALPYRGIRFTEAGCSAEGRFCAGNDGLGIRRTILHERLVERAAQIGVAMRWGVPVRSIGQTGVEIGGRIHPCRWIIGADGRESFVRRRAGFRPPKRMRRRVGLRQHFRVRPWTELVEVHWHDRGQAIVTPISSQEICVSLLINDVPGRFTDMVRLYPELWLRLRDAQPSSPVRGAISGSSVMRSVVRGRVALIGDAAGAVDALTGEGLSLGFRHAIVLADALEENNLGQYDHLHRSISRPPELMAKLMLLVGARRALRRRVLDALGAQSRLFAFMLNVHTGTIPLTVPPIAAFAEFFRHLVIGRSNPREGVAAK